MTEHEESIRVVIDTNIFISGIFWHGKPHLIIEAWKEKQFTLVFSQATIDELIGKLQGKFNMDQEGINYWMDLILTEGIIIQPQFFLSFCRDPKDNMFLEAAVAGRALYLVTRDDDLKRDIALIAKMKTYGVKIISVKQFLEILDERLP